MAFHLSKSNGRRKKKKDLVRIGCIQFFLQKLNGQPRLDLITKGPPALEIRKPTQRLTITWSSPSLTFMPKKTTKNKQ